MKVEPKKIPRPLLEEDSWVEHWLGWRNAVEERHRSRARRRAPVRDETPVEGAPQALSRVVSFPIHAVFNVCLFYCDVEHAQETHYSMEFFVGEDAKLFEQCSSRQI